MHFLLITGLVLIAACQIGSLFLGFRFWRDLYAYLMGEADSDSFLEETHRRVRWAFVAATGWTLGLIFVGAALLLEHGSI